MNQSANLVLNFWKDAPLLPVANAMALSFFPSPAPLWTCRAAVTLISGIGAIILFNMGGWWALIFYLLNPFSFFLDRTVLMEPVLNTAVLGFMSMSLWAMKRATKKALMLTGIATVLMLSAKQTAILVLPIPLMFAWFNKSKYRHWKEAAVVIGATGLIMVGLAVKFTLLWDTAAMHMNVSLDWLRIKTNVWLMANWLIAYWTWLMVPVIILGWRSKWLLVIAYFMSIFAAVGWTLFPRYLLVIVPFVSLIAGQAAKNTVGKFLLLGLLAIFVRRDITILLAPEKAVIARETRYQFFEDWGSGAGTKMALGWLGQQQLDLKTVLFVPQDIQGLWVMSTLSFAPQLNLSTKFYTTDANLLNQVEANQHRPIFLIATTHHGQLVNLVKQKYMSNRLFTTNGDNRNSVTIDTINL